MSFPTLDVTPPPKAEDSLAIGVAARCNTGPVEACKDALCGFPIALPRQTSSDTVIGYSKASMAYLLSALGWLEIIVKLWLIWDLGVSKSAKLPPHPLLGCSTTGRDFNCRGCSVEARPWSILYSVMERRGKNFLALCFSRRRLLEEAISDSGWCLRSIIRERRWNSVGSLVVREDLQDASISRTSRIVFGPALRGPRHVTASIICRAILGICSASLIRDLSILR